MALTPDSLYDGTVAVGAAAALYTVPAGSYLYRPMISFRNENVAQQTLNVYVQRAGSVSRRLRPHLLNQYESACPDDLVGPYGPGDSILAETTTAGAVPVVVAGVLRTLPAGLIPGTVADGVLPDGAVGNVYTVPAGQRFYVTMFAFCNENAAQQTVDLYLRRVALATDRGLRRYVLNQWVSANPRDLKGPLSPGDIIRAQTTTLNAVPYVLAGILRA